MTTGTPDRRQEQRRGEARVEAVSNSEPAGEYDVYLVAGTWGAGVLRTVFRKGLPPPAAWTEEGQEFVTMLRDLLPAKPRVLRLLWRGRNRVADRQDGARVLAKELAKDPTRRKLVIGHSHAGNLIVRALEQGGRKGVAGVVCLNTPFYAYLRRNVLGAYASWVFLLVLGGMVWLLSARASPWFLLYGVLWAVGLFASLSLESPIERWEEKEKGKDKGKEKGEEGDSAANPPAEVYHAAPFLCLTTREDEAFGALNLAETLGNVPFMLLGKWSPWIFAAVAMILTSVGRLPSLGAGSPPSLSLPWWGLPVSLLALVGLAIGVRRFAPRKWSPWSFAVLTAAVTSLWWLPWMGSDWNLWRHLKSAFAWAAAAFFLLLLLTVLAVVVSRFLAQGLWDLSTPYLFRALVTLTPLAARRVKFMEFEPSPGGDLNHSMVYQDAERTCGEIARWIGEEVDLEGDGSRGATARAPT